MSYYTIEIDEKVVDEKIGNILNLEVNRYLATVCHASYATVADAVKEIVYSRKNEIIETVVERATKEIVKKGLPKLLERYSDE